MQIWDVLSLLIVCNFDEHLYQVFSVFFQLANSHLNKENNFSSKGYLCRGGKTYLLMCTWIFSCNSLIYLWKVQHGSICRLLYPLCNCFMQWRGELYMSANVCMCSCVLWVCVCVWFYLNVYSHMFMRERDSVNDGFSTHIHVGEEKKIR